jgi:hypothetical protein
VSKDPDAALSALLRIRSPLARLDVVCARILQEALRALFDCLSPQVLLAHR